jgi:LacI family transcriptional regulator
MSSRPRKTRNATIKDVAREAGVSYSTVSRVLNDYQHVKSEKREQVIDAMKRLGYVANPQARSLVSGRSQVLGLLVHDLGNAYTAEIIHGIEETLVANGYELMLYTTHRQKNKEAIFVNTLTYGLIDGLLLLLPLNPGGYLENLQDQRFPYVVIDHQGFDDSSPAVVATNWQGAYDATCYLIELGHRKIGFVAGTPEMSSAVERLDAYKVALTAHGIGFRPDLVQNGDFKQHPGYVAANALLDLADPPTAIFAANDLSAMGVCEAIRSRGLHIPEDMSVIGFDDIPEARLMHPPLTTVRQPLIDMGRLATRMLLEHIQNPNQPASRIVLPTELIIRSSCRQLGAAQQP